MKRFLAIFAVLALFQTGLSAQVYEDLEADFRGRISAGAEFKVAKGLKLEVGAEFRGKDLLRAVDRIDVGAGLGYKPCPYFKMGAYYDFFTTPKLEVGEENTDWRMFHRASVDLIGMYKWGNWGVSLKERLQFTHRVGDMNVYQNPRNSLVLKSRVKMEYICRSLPLIPSLAMELRTPLNGVRFNSPDATTPPGGNISYTDAYLSRVRIEPALAWRLNYQNRLTFSILGDYNMGKSFDAKKDGTLKKLADGSYAIYYGKSFNTSLCVGYTFIF